jgi:hypothetical protein
MKTPPSFGGVFAFFWEEFAFKFGFSGLFDGKRMQILGGRATTWGRPYRPTY